MNARWIPSAWFRHTVVALTVVSGVMLLSGCETAPSHWQDAPKKEIASALAEASKDTLTVPPDVSQAMLPPLKMSLPNGGESLFEPHFDLSANNSPARQVFMSLVKDTPYSMVVRPDLTGTISLHLKDVTVPDAVEALRQVYGYEYRREGKRYFILGQGLQTRMFPVNYLNFDRKGQSTTRVSSSELTNASQNNNGRNSGSGKGGGGGFHGIEVHTTSESNFWKELSSSLEAIIGKEEGRRVVVDPQAGLVIVRAMPDELDMVERFLGITQATVNRQVILEAKIIEVELKDGFQTGINWAAMGSVGNTDALISQTGGGTLLNSGASENVGNTGSITPNGTIPAIGSGKVSAFGGIFSMAIKAPDFAAFLELLKTQGSLHVLSSPRVSTVNNQKAVIKVGGDEFFVTGISNSATTTGASTTQTPSVELTPFFSGIALDVTPQIDANSHVTLHIHPTVSNVSQKEKNFVVSGENFSLPLAFSTIQESDNVVRAKTGQIIVIGGLMKEASTSDHASIPLLGDVPVIGNLFKHQRLTRIKKELVILLKPTIMDDGSSWTEAIRPAQKRTDDLMNVGRR